MAVYYLNKTAAPGGECEVHTAMCFRIASPSDVTYLGQYAACSEAIKAALDHCDFVNGCLLCCPQCHRPAGYRKQSP